MIMEADLGGQHAHVPPPHPCPPADPAPLDSLCSSPCESLSPAPTGAVVRGGPAVGDDPAAPLCPACSGKRNPPRQAKGRK